MKKFLLILASSLAIMAVSCNKEKEVPCEIKVQLTVDGQPFAQEGVTVTLSDGSSTFDAVTIQDGTASFSVLVGAYTASSSFKKSEAGLAYNYNGSASITVSKDAEKVFDLPLTPSKSSQLIIKEVYNGGCMDNANSKNYQYDKYIIIYNNSDIEVDASKMCIAMAQISNTNSTNKYAGTDGKNTYEVEGWTPASFSIWWFQDGVNVKIAPFGQIVVALNGAIDHTATYNNSVDLSKADYVMYDKESGFNLAAAYPAPAESIPADHQMKTVVFGQGTAWPFPILTASPFIIMPGSDIKAFLDVADNFDNKSTNKSGNYAKIPTEWVLDALDIWSAADETKFFSRFPSAVNTGYQVLTNKLGYTTYRNVDKIATEAIVENEGKLVYNYAGAVDNENDGDPSGIDAEASIANGAKIVYMDTNNSANDFHQRKVASLKK